MNKRGRPLSPVERRFFESFFRRLNESRIPHILLRNYEEFPVQIGNDLDTFFRRSDLPTAVDLFHNVLREFDGELLHTHERDYFCAVWFRATQEEPLPLHLDFYHGAFTWHGLPYLSDAELLESSRQLGDFRVPRPAHEALNLFLGSLLWGGFFKSRYAERIQTLLRSEGEKAEFQSLTERMFGKAGRESLALLEQPDTNTPTHASKLRNALRWRSLVRNPIRTIARLIRYWCVELKTLFNPPGIYIAVLGPDGAGKSTVIEALKEELGCFFGETVQHHWRPTALPDLGVLLGRRQKAIGAVSDPHAHPPHSPLASLGRLLYYWLDYWFGYPLRVWKPRAKNHLVVFDRYAPDMWCDPKRYRLRLPKRVSQLVCALVPQPKFTFVLVADTELIHARKPEIQPEAVTEMLARYNELAGQETRFVKVDCSRPIADISKELAMLVIKHLKGKSEWEGASKS